MALSLQQKALQLPIRGAISRSHWLSSVSRGAAKRRGLGPWPQEKSEEKSVPQPYCLSHNPKLIERGFLAVDLTLSLGFASYDSVSGAKAVSRARIKCGCGTDFTERRGERGGSRHTPSTFAPSVIVRASSIVGNSTLVPISGTLYYTGSSNVDGRTYP